VARRKDLPSEEEVQATFLTRLALILNPGLDEPTTYELLLALMHDGVTEDNLEYYGALIMNVATQMSNKEVH
jgi:hypothetical protein